MVGGFSFARSKFNRATQAYPPARVHVQAVSLHGRDRSRPDADLDPGRRLARVVRRRRRTAAVHAGQLRRQVRRARDAAPRARTVAQHPRGARDGDARAAQVVGLREALRVPAKTFRPFLSTALGAAEATLLEITSAYSAFPNHGIRLQPFSGDVDPRSRRQRARRDAPDAARRDPRRYRRSCMTNLLRGVVQRGTGGGRHALDWPLAGKTGTVDDYTDAWFVGFDPNITVGVWVGLRREEADRQRRNRRDHRAARSGSTS